MEDRDLTVLVERCEALSASRFAFVLAEQDRSWRSESQPLAGGHLVLCGAGLYVNRGIALGFDAPLTDADIDVVESRSAAVGVTPAVEVTCATHPGTLEALDRRGYVHDAGADVSVYAQALDATSASLPVEVLPALERIVVTATSLDHWIEVSALGWEHTTPAARRAADAFARAAFAIEGDGMVVAIDAADGRPLGCASLRIEGTVATLGGMSTIPEERGRGVQSALIRYRLNAARHAGCTIAASSARCGSASERNLARHGFEPLTVKRLLTRPR